MRYHYELVFENGKRVRGEVRCVTPDQGHDYLVSIADMLHRWAPKIFPSDWSMTILRPIH